MSYFHKISKRSFLSMVILCPVTCCPTYPVDYPRDCTNGQCWRCMCCRLLVGVMLIRPTLPKPWVSEHEASTTFPWITCLNVMHMVFSSTCNNRRLRVRLRITNISFHKKLSSQNVLSSYFVQTQVYFDISGIL